MTISPDQAMGNVMARLERHEATSPYLRQPPRPLDQAKADIRLKRAKSLPPIELTPDMEA